MEEVILIEEARNKVVELLGMMAGVFNLVRAVTKVVEGTLTHNKVEVISREVIAS